MNCKQTHPAKNPMAVYAGILLMILYPVCTYGQSKLYVSSEIGRVHIREPSLLQLMSSFQTLHMSAGIEYERRLAGAFNFITGLSASSLSYHQIPDQVVNRSSFRATFISLPLLARWNAGNKNVWMADAGLISLFLANAFLDESTVKFGNPVNVRGDITGYSQRLLFAYRFRLSFLINRFSAGLFLTLPLKGQSTIKDLQSTWGLNSQQSPYIGSNGFSNFYYMGINVGVRIL